MGNLANGIEKGMRGDKRLELNGQTAIQRRESICYATADNEESAPLDMPSQQTFIYNTHTQAQRQKRQKPSNPQPARAHTFVPPTMAPLAASQAA